MNKHFELPGVVYFYDSNGLRHREDGPAEIWPNGTKRFFKHGEAHSYNDYPSTIFSNGVLMWHYEGTATRLQNTPYNRDAHLPCSVFPPGHRLETAGYQEIVKKYVTENPYNI